MVRFAWVGVLLVAVGACSEDVNPCAEGFRISYKEDRCVAMVVPDADVSPATPSEASADDAEPDGTRIDDASSEPDASGPDLTDTGVVDTSSDASDAAAAPMDADMDATHLVDAEAPDVITAMDSADGALDAGELDAASDADPADGATDGSTLDAADADAVVPACSSEDTDAWRAGHLRSDMRDAAAHCRVSCDAGIDCADDCLRQANNVQDCKSCTLAQTRCAAERCTYACLPSAGRSNRTCLACLCQTDCFGVFSSCAGRELGLCSAELFASDPSVQKGPLQQPAILFGKSGTGLLRNARIDPDTAVQGTELGVTYIPTGPARFLDLSIDGRDFALYYSAVCAAPPCTVLAYPLLEDGTFGVPFSAGRWEQDFIDAEFFSAHGAKYLMRTRLPNVSEPANVWIDRVALDASTQRLVLTPVARSTLRSGTDQHYDRAEPLAIEDDVYLFAHAPRSGEARFFRLVPASEGVDLVPASGAFFLSKGWDRVEAFRSDDRWYLFGFKTGQVETSGEAAGQAQLWTLTRDAQGRVGLGDSIFNDFWGVGFTYALSYTAPSGRASFVFIAPQTESAPEAVVETYPLGADPAGWSDNFRWDVVRTVRRGDPRWDIFGLVKQGKW